jgi:hypothetical protein
LAALSWQTVVTAGVSLSLNRFGDCEQHNAVVDGVQAVAGGGDDEVIAGSAVPAGVGTGQSNAPVQYLDRGLSRTFMIVEAGASSQGNQRLSQRVLVAAVHGVCTAAAVRVVGGRQMLSAERGQRDLIHVGCPGSQ